MVKVPKVRAKDGKLVTFRSALVPLSFGRATRRNGFDQLCADPGIAHRLTAPMRSQTNVMVAQFNRRIEDVLQNHRFNSGEDPKQTMLRQFMAYNRQLR